MAKVMNPHPLFLDGRGALLDAGHIYVGTANTDPTILANQLPLFFDNARTIPAPQPLRTLGGLIVNGQNPTLVFLASDDYSQTVTDADSILVSYIPSSGATGGPGGGPAYQAEDADLTAIAALATTAYGRNLLTLANQAALKSATGIPDCLPKAGGAMTGDITRQGGGVYPYFAAAGMTKGRIYLTAVGAADPTSQPGDIWLSY